MYIEKNISSHTRLDQFLKWAGVAATGGMAKILIQNGEIAVNGKIETQRGKKLSHGDLVQTPGGVTYQIMIKEN